LFGFGQLGHGSEKGVGVLGDGSFGIGHDGSYVSWMLEPL
jgi:hypothetical protein